MTDAWGASWGGTFIVWEAAQQVTEPEFGPPFLDGQAEMISTLGGVSTLITAVGHRAPLATAIEKASRFASTRISKSAK